MSEVLQYRFPGARRRPIGDGRARRPRPRQPADRRDDRGRGRRLRGRRPADEPDPGRPRPGRAGVADAADAPRPTGRRIDRRRPVDDHADRRDRARLAHARATSQRVRGRAARDRRRRAHRPRPGQPVHEPPAEPAHPGDPRRRRRARRRPRIFVCNVATQDGETTGLRPRRARRGPGRTHRARTSSTSCWPTTTSRPATRTADVRRRATARRPPCACAGRLRSSRPRGSSSTTWSTRPTPTTTIRPGWPRRVMRALERERPAPPVDGRGRPAGPPDVTRSERDLVTALRDELAAIDPSRPCDRRPRRPGSGPDDRAERDGVRRPARGPARAGRAADASAAPAVRLGDAPRTTAAAAWLRGRFLARGSLSLAGGRTHLEFVVAPDEAPELAAPPGRVRPAGVVAAPPRPRRRDLEERRGGRHVPPPDRRGGACSRSRRARSRGRCAASSTACSTPNRPTSSAPSAPPAASSTRSRRSTPTAGWPTQPDVVRLVAAARRETPEASLAELAERLEIHRSAVQRALERLERLATTERRRARRVRPTTLWHDSPRCAT